MRYTRVTMPQGVSSYVPYPLDRNAPSQVPKIDRPELKFLEYFRLQEERR